MFPKLITEQIDAATTPFNPDIANGLAVSHMRYVDEYVDRIFRLTSEGFPPGLEYLGRQRCTPVAEYAEATRKRSNRCSFDVAPTNVVLTEYMFAYKGQKLASRFLYLPYVGKAGTIYVSGSRFVISPILADRVISVGMSSIFVRLNKAKLTFNRSTHHYVVKGARLDERESMPVAYGDIYNKKPQANAPKPTVRANCTLVHYLLCKYGLGETFRRFGNVDVVVGEEEINPETYPESDWVICASVGIKPSRQYKMAWQAPTIRLAIPRNKYTTMVKSLVAGFFYVVDHFPTDVETRYVHRPELWMWLLGNLIWSGGVGRGKLVTDVTDHIASLDEYIDEMIRDKLRGLGYECKDLYELFALIIDKFYDWLLTSDDRVSTMYDKELSILPFVCYEIISAVNNLYFKLKAASKKELVPKKIESIMSMNLRPGLIFKITKEHGEVTTTSTSGDNMALKITNLLVPQSSSTRNKGKKDRVAITDPGKRLHASIAEVGQAFSLPKSEPSGRSRVALTLQLGDTGLVLRDPRHMEMLDSVQAKIRR